MAGCVVRAAGVDDIAALVALDTFAAPDNERAAEIVRWVNAGQCDCAALNGNLAGYAIVHLHFFCQPMLELVMVGNAYRRQGIGEALVRHAIAAATGPVLWTSTNRSNTAMQALLEKLGFNRSGIVEGLDDGDPELIYRIATRQ